VMNSRRLIGLSPAGKIDNPRSGPMTVSQTALLEQLSHCRRDDGGVSRTRRRDRWSDQDKRAGPSWGGGRHFCRARETVARCKPTHPSPSAR